MQCGINHDSSSIGKFAGVAQNNSEEPHVEFFQQKSSCLNFLPVFQSTFAHQHHFHDFFFVLLVSVTTPGKNHVYEIRCLLHLVTAGSCLGRGS